MEQDNPLISVIVNCHNGDRYLKESVQSIFDQTYKNWEIIFWDNLSTDNSQSIIQKFDQKKIKYFKSEKFMNLYDARNEAISKSAGSFISFLDTDDWWNKDKLETQVNLFKKDDGLGLVYSNYYIFNEKTKKSKIFVKNKLPEGEVTQKLLNNYVVGLLTILIRKEIFQKHNFNKNYNIIGDFDFVIKLSMKSRFASIDEPLAYYRKHKKNLSDTSFELYISEIKEWIRINEESFKKNGYSLNNQKFLLRKLQIKKFLKKIIYFYK